jgi:EAL domain-containing protein (putative c-di-GMP-specific phosphodiesterase class I)/CheY-like chemotaxis protein
MDEMYTSRTALIVDDDRFVLHTSAAVLRKLGFKHIKLADNVPDAISILAQSSPSVSLVISDLNMPDTDGLELLRHFEEHGFDGDIILFSGEDRKTLKMAEALANARQLSVLGAIEKPLHPATLQQLLAQERKQKSNTKSAPEKSVKVTPDMLEEAIENGEIVPWFQPVIDTTNYRPIAVEALSRWTTKSGQSIPPIDFIALAERHQLIDKLTYSIIEQAATLDNQWQKQGIDLKISINIFSITSFYNLWFPEYLDMAVTGFGGALNRFQLEVTETQLMQDLVRPLEVLLRLHMKRVGLSIDDFGTGHSNLTQIRDLPFDEIKIDRSYIQSSAQSERGDVILKSSIEMAKELGLSIVAKGVESEKDWERVVKLGCDQAQGYYIAKPMPGDDIQPWVESWSLRSKRLFDL